jgi:hypothetical protein
MRIVRNLGVSLHDRLCDVALFMPSGYYVSAQSLDSLDLANTSHPLLIGGYFD